MRPSGSDSAFAVKPPQIQTLRSQRLSDRKLRPASRDCALARSAVARELGLSERTLQRLMTEEGANFRQLLLQARQELVHQYLTHPDVQVADVAFLLGYEDSNSFYAPSARGKEPHQSTGGRVYLVG